MHTPLATQKSQIDPRGPKFLRNGTNMEKRHQEYIFITFSKLGTKIAKIHANLKYQTKLETSHEVCSNLVEIRNFFRLRLLLFVRDKFYDVVGVDLSALSRDNRTFIGCSWSTDRSGCWPSISFLSCSQCGQCSASSGAWFFST